MDRGLEVPARARCLADPLDALGRGRRRLALARGHRRLQLRDHREQERGEGFLDQGLEALYVFETRFDVFAQTHTLTQILVLHVKLGEPLPCLVDIVRQLDRWDTWGVSDVFVYAHM